MRITAIIFFLVSLWPYASTASGLTVGVTRLVTEVANTELGIRVFYPANTEVTITRFGPWEILASKNAIPAKGSSPLVAISHGLGGNEWNHHLLATQLVKSGFVVAAVRHAEDLLRVGNPEIAVLRPLELKAAIDVALSNGRFSDSIDSERIGAFGFSLGGFTVLANAGGRTDWARIALHCTHSQNDPEFCVGEKGGQPLPILLRLRRFFYSLPKIDLKEDVYDSRIKSVVIVAPVGLPFNGALCKSRSFDSILKPRIYTVSHQ